MVDQLDCPNCGRGNDREMAEAYRVCVHCGGDMGSVVGASPMSDLQRSIDGQPPPAQEPPVQEYPSSQQQPPQQQPPQQQYQQPPQQQYQQPPQQQYQQPPPYGQPPPAYGAQPYAGQPYPPPGFAPGPGYGYPPPGMYPPTYHPGVYERPEKEPYIDVGNLFRLLTRPKEAFEDLYDHTTGTQGIILAIMFIVISGVIGLAANLAILGTIDLPEGGTVPGMSMSSGIGSMIGIFINIAFFFMTAWMFHSMVKGKGRHPSLSKTMGMMGYAKFPAFIIGVLMAIVLPIMFIDADIEDPDALGAFCGVLALVLGLGLVGLLWAFWVHSHAQSVANDVSTGTAFGYLLLTWIVVYIITAVIGFMVTIALVGTTI